MSATLQSGNIREAGSKPVPATLVRMAPVDTPQAIPAGGTWNHSARPRRSLQAIPTERGGVTGQASEHIAKVWGVSPGKIPDSGESAWELLSKPRTSSEARTPLVFGSNSIISAIDAVHAEKRLRNLDFLMVCDFVVSETAGLPDVVLPTAQWAESGDPITNLEGRALRCGALRKPPPGTGTDLAVLTETAHRLGHRDEAVRANGARSIGARVPSDPRATFEEPRRATAGGVADNAGVTWERVDAEDGVFRPCPPADRAGAPRLFEEAFATPAEQSGGER